MGREAHSWASGLTVFLLPFWCLSFLACVLRFWETMLQNFGKNWVGHWRCYGKEGKISSKVLVLFNAACTLVRICRSWLHLFWNTHLNIKKSQKSVSWNNWIICEHVLWELADSGFVWWCKCVSMWEVVSRHINTLKRLSGQFTSNVTRLEINLFSPSICPWVLVWPDVFS